jgi:glycosyltransferase involved in cell wall biosynthesis
MTTVLFDGWSLVYQGNSPAALHLLALLTYTPPEVRAVLALPAASPPWLPAGIETVVQDFPDTPGGRLNWEQRGLLAIAKEVGASRLHLTKTTPPVLGTQTCLVSPASTEFEGERPYINEDIEPLRGVAERLRRALAHGGMSRVQALLWPADLPAPPGRWPVVLLPPVVHPGFFEPNLEGLDALDLPESYVLYHGSDEEADLRRLLETWQWAAGPVGEVHPLLVLGLSQAAAQRMETLLESYPMRQTVRTLPEVDPQIIPAIYRGAAALLHSGPLPAWGGAVRQALASRLPVAAEETPQADAMVGNAAYLSPPANRRALAAALISIIVEESLGAALAEAAGKRAAGWDTALFSEKLRRLYRGERDLV